MADVCTDNRFELIEKYKQKLIDGTNIEHSLDEMSVIDNILFRFWQMGWLDKLEQPTQTNAHSTQTNALDCVSRQQAIDALDGFRCGTKAAWKVIEDLPSAQPQRKTGKWITDTKYYEDGWQDFYYVETRCSVCGVRKRIGWYDANYCPSCGADMRGKEKE